VELKADKNEDKYINLFYHGDKLISFMTFELKKSTHKYCGGDFTLFYAMLAATNSAPQYARLGLTKLALRVPLALSVRQPQDKIFMFMESLPPGYGLCVLPRFSEFFPKNELSPSFCKHVATLAEVDLHGKMIPEEIQVKQERFPDKNSQTPTNNHVLEYFEHIVRRTNHAMGVIFMYNAENKQLFLNDLRFNSVGGRNLDDFAATFERLQSPPEATIKVKAGM